MKPGRAPRAGHLLGLSLALVAAACSPSGAPPAAGAARQDEAAYLPPPVVDQVSAEAGATRLGGQATAGAKVRLASPGGAELATTAEGGRWSLAVPGAGAPRVFGLSQSLEGRTTQAEGYVFLGADGGGWLLRSGGAARPLGSAPARGLVIDYDRSGGAVVSGPGPAGALLVAQLDGRRAGEGRADPKGRFEIRLNGPAPMGESRLRVFGEGLNLETRIRLSPPAPLTAGPVRAEDRGQGLRIDWMTPGGGVQTTQILP